MGTKQKSSLTKKVGLTRAKIERGIHWATSNGFQLRDGLYCAGGAVCPLASVVARKEKLNFESAEWDYKTIRAEKANGNDELLLADAVGITETQASAFIAGFDVDDEGVDARIALQESGVNRVTKSVLAFYNLGRRLRDKHIGV